jgi:AraC family transcriptional regulator
MTRQPGEPGSRHKRPIWRVPGLEVLRTRSWAPLTVQEVRGSGGEGVWRNPHHRISLIESDAQDLTFQFESGRVREVVVQGPRLVFCPAGATMRVRSGAIRWTQVVQDPTPWRALASEARLNLGALEPLIAFEDPLIAEMMRTLLREVEAGPIDRLLVDALNAAIALRLLAKFAKSPAAPRIQEHGLSRERLQRVCDYIEAHLGDELTLDTLADIACLSRFHFSRSFKRALGIGVHRYVMQRRLERAKLLIAERAMTLSEVAYIVGFKSQAAFTHLFRQRVGMTPGRFRREVA